MANPSTIWAQLAMPNPPAGSVPFVLSDGATIGTDVLNFWYDPTLDELHTSNSAVIKSQQNQAGVASPVTINYPSGIATIKAGASSVVVNNNKVRTNALVFIQRRNVDATAISLSVTVGVGSMTITSNANATGDVNVNFLLVNVDIQTS